HMERLFQDYPEIVCGIMEKLYRLDGVPRSKILKMIRRETSKKVKTKDMVSDIIKIGRALL
ncbi:FAD-dependent oxidoreductase, partial [Chloroflexota bacterium]